MVRNVSAARAWFVMPRSRGAAPIFAKMGAAPRDRGMTNHALAAETFLTIAPVHPMPHLKCAALSVCSLVIRNRRAFESYGVFQNRLHRAIEAVYLRVAQVAA